MPLVFRTRTASPELSEAKKGGRGISLVEQNASEKKLFTQARGLENVSNTCSTNLALGNSKFGITDEDCLGFTRYAKIRKVEPSTSPDVPMSASCQTRTSGLPLELVYPTNTSHTRSESPKRPRAESVKDLKLGTSADNSFLSLSTFGFSEGSYQTSEKYIVSGTPPYGSLCYQPPQLKNLAISLENGGSPSTANSSRQPNGQFSCSTPPHLALSISVSSSRPESILRNSAMSYKNTPSIIRKRTPREAISVNCSCPSTPGQVQTRSSGHDCCKNVKTSESENTKRGSDSWLHRSQPSLGRRLDYMFDSEWDPTMVRCCSPGSVTPSSKANMMLTP